MVHVRHAYWGAFQHDCVNIAKATAYSAIFAVFPALLVAAAAVTMLPQMNPMRFELALFFDRVLPATVGPMLENYFIFANRSPQSTHVLIGAALVSVSGAAGVIGTLMEGFRRAYGRGRWGEIERRVRAFALVPLAVVPFTITSILVVFGHTFLLWLLQHTPGEAKTSIFVMASVVRWIVSLAGTATAIALIYRWGTPPGRSPATASMSLREVLPGAWFATAMWLVSTLGFGLYVRHFANYSEVYGSLGAGVLLLVWLFISSLSVLCGAELNVELCGHRKHRE